MECKELFIFENGQPLTTPPPQVSFWAFRLTVKLTYLTGDEKLKREIKLTHACTDEDRVALDCIKIL